MLNIIFFNIAVAVYLVHAFIKLKRDVHMLQQNSYMNDRYMRWLRGNLSRNIRIRDFIPLITLGLVFAGIPYLWHGAWIVLYALLIASRPKVQEKKKLVITARVKRLFATAGILYLALAAVFNLTGAYDDSRVLLVSAAVLVVINIFSFAFLLVVNTINLPMEKYISNWYVQDAKRMIRQMPRLKVIGITGSYGKTSVKYILYRILSERFNVLMTPESFNTTMGVTRTIRTSLKPTHDIFIAEMGAKKPGDIKELCDLAQPRYGVITAVGEQHLETFKSLENIKKTKFELVESLPEDGVAFLNMDNKVIRETPEMKKTIRYGIETDKLHYWAEDICFSAKGSTFTLCKYDGSKAQCTTRLLGRHNILNIVAAASVAGELGMDLGTIAFAARTLEPVPHRLQLKRSVNGVTIIDDAYNSNPEGSRMALEVLQGMDSGKRILITPGMIELGSIEYEANKQFGERAADACDYIILVGARQTVPIQEGLKSKGFPEDRLYIAKDLKDALGRMQAIVEPGSVVLFENDLPDTYNE